MSDFENISNSDLSALIDEWTKNEIYRKLLKRRLIDGLTYEKLAEEFQMSVYGVKKIVYHEQEVLFKQIERENDIERQFLNGEVVPIL